MRGRWHGGAVTDEVEAVRLRGAVHLSVSLRLPAPLKGEPKIVNPLPRSAGKGVLFGGYSFSSSIISSVTMDSGVLRVSKSR